MDVAIHWQDADSSSAKAVREIYPKAKIMLCGGHAGRKILSEKKILPPAHIEKYKTDFPFICKEEYQSCKCVAVDVAVLVTPLYPKHTPISLLF